MAGSNPLRIADVTLRDGQQMLLHSLLRGDDLVRVAAALDAVGLSAIEAWGGGAFAGGLVQLHEDPFELLSRLNHATPRTPLQVMLRGQNLAGERNYADDVVDAFVARAAENGADIFRVFDPLNDVRNMERVIAAARAAGKRVEGGICYTLSPVHTTEALVELSRQLVGLGCDALWIKDTAGLLTPTSVVELVREIKRATRVPLAVHSHSTRGLGGMVHLAGALAGADTVDACLSPLSGGASHPPTESLVIAAEGTGRDTGLDNAALDRARAELETVLEERGLEADQKLTVLDASLFRYGVPGTMMTVLRRTMDEHGLGEDRLEAVLGEVDAVRRDLGYPPLLMPVSRLVAEQAVLNIARGKRYERFADDVRAYVEGLYGRPPAPVEDGVMRAAIGRNQPISMRPADLLQPELPGARRLLRSEKIKRDDDEAALMVAILGKAALPFLRGEPAPVGATEEEPVASESAEERVEAATAAIGAEVAAPDDGASAGGGQPSAQMATAPGAGFTVEVDGDPYRVRVIPDPGSAFAFSPGGGMRPAAGAAVPGPGRDEPPPASAEGAVAAPMQGLLLKVRVREGDRVELGEEVAVLEAMKMQNSVTATKAGTIARIYAQEGSVVRPNQVLMTVS